jgi:sugar/nucleoside kinase (ribokinase family)
MKKGIAIAGNILTDNVKVVEVFPERGMLATIKSETLAVGGCVPNTAIDVKKLDQSLPVKVYGRVGNDYKGEYVVEQMKSVGLDVSGVKVSVTAPTSYSDVITVESSGERTFFHNRGANAEFTCADVDVDGLDCDIFHAGYIMLLDAMDVVDQDGRTGMSRLLESVRAKGIKTSVDLVSESSGNFNRVVKSALPFCDYVIINEVEAGSIAGISPRTDGGKISESAVKEIMQAIMCLGVKEKVIVHCPEKGFALDKSGKFSVKDSIKLKDGFIKGSVGAGDAFCAGALYSLYNGFDDEYMLEFSNLVAINCLSEKDSVSGIVSADRLKDVLA